MTPASARAAMVERLRSDGTLKTHAVERALATIPRHHFITWGDPETAYADIAITVKTSRDGTAISSASQPTIVAAMLELSQLEPGHRVLEIGTGTGYNAALLASIVEGNGCVVTVELEDDLAVTARKRLSDRNFGQVEVVTGDGAAGHPEASPYDRIIVTTGAPRIPDAWNEQLRHGGLLVVPVVNSDGLGKIHCLLKQQDGLDEITTMPCGFLPMRSP